MASVGDIFLVGHAPEGVVAQPSLEGISVSEISDGGRRTELLRRFARGSRAPCWLVVGDAYGQWREYVAALRGNGLLDQMPWALWLRARLARAAIQEMAWEEGAPANPAALSKGWAMVSLSLVCML
jgi:hypothetical protein